MVVLDNLVVTTALPSIRTDLGGGLQALEWTVNAYTLTFAVLLLTGAALGDRFGRRRMFVIGLGIFTVASAAAALAPTTGALIAARALQGAGAAIVTPLTLTLLVAAFPPRSAGSRSAPGRASPASPSRSARSSAAPSSRASPGTGSSGSTCRSGSRWRRSRRGTSPSRYGPADRLDLPGLALGGLGLLGIVYGIVRGAELGWTSATVLGSLVAGAVLLAAFVAWELRAPAPMLPMRFFRSRAFSAANGVSLAMYFGVFGSIFLLAQFFQVTQGLSPLEAGLRTCRGR